VPDHVECRIHAGEGVANSNATSRGHLGLTPLNLAGGSVMFSYTASSGQPIDWKLHTSGGKMGNLLGVAILLVVVYLAIKYKGVRYFILGSLALVVIVVFLYDAKYKKEEKESKERISIHEVELEGLELSGLSRLRGRVRNLSPSFTLTQIELELSLQEKSSLAVEVVGQTKTTIYVRVPPKQSRDIDEYVHFSNVQPDHRDLTWFYRVTFVRAIPPQQD
jgi:hypothetical protein